MLYNQGPHAGKSIILQMILKIVTLNVQYLWVIYWIIIFFWIFLPYNLFQLKMINLKW